MNFKTYTIMFAVGALTLLPACSGDDPDDGPDVRGPRHEITLNAQQKQDVAKVNEFGYRLWNNLQNSDDSRNDFYSPLGVHFVLSMLANGAEGETLQQITDLLGSDDLDALNQLDKKLLAELPKVDRTARLSIANSCWVDKNARLLSAYSAAMKDVFGSPVMRYNKGTDAARIAVNKWCSSKTDGMIPEFLNDNPDYDLLLLNALFFQGRWREPFDKSKTVPAPFHNADGTVSTVDMMNGTVESTYCGETEKGYIADLFYGNEGFCMRLIVPREGYELKDITDEEIFGDVSIFDRFDLDLSLPRFSITGDYQSIAAAIADMGYDRIFSNADYTGIFADKGIDIFTGLAQKSCIEVNESGTRAAAVTGGWETSPGPATFSKLVVDRPFLFTITESSTGVVLFMGKVAKL